MKVLITGSAGFIGYHLAKLLLENGSSVVGIDAMTEYYDVNIKRARNKLLEKYDQFVFYENNIENEQHLHKIFLSEMPEVIIHLAAQAGVRHSIDSPRSYIDANIIGTFNIVEMARNFGCKHLLFASTSSVYGGNTVMPFVETQRTDLQMSLYAATKKACEAITHSYSHLFKIPTTSFRFFTAYGPWGRPDMALFKFTHAIFEGKEIEIYNQGNMYRDFVYVDDLVESIKRLINNIPGIKPSKIEGDSLSSIAPWRSVNIASENPIKLTDFIFSIERATGKLAQKKYLEIQPGDVPKTWADISLLQNLTNYVPQTELQLGVNNFVNWYKNYYQI
jgi:UDP-glucuronate 4-epimerase